MNFWSIWKRIVNPLPVTRGKICQQLRWAVLLVAQPQLWKSCRCYWHCTVRKTSFYLSKAGNGCWNKLGAAGCSPRVLENAWTAFVVSDKYHDASNNSILDYCVLHLQIVLRRLCKESRGGQVSPGTWSSIQLWLQWFRQTLIIDTRRNTRIQARFDIGHE